MARLAADMAMVARPGDCLALSGDLGAGKTSFARAFIRALAGEPDLEVPSPTFTLVQTYDTRPPVAHYDLYRIGEPDELDELGLDEALETGLALIEWPERAGNLLPAGAIGVTLTETRTPSGEPARTVRIDAPDEAMTRLARSLAVRDLLASGGHGQAERAPLAGDASTRRYETVRDRGWRAIVMDSPPMPDGPPIRDGKPYSRIAHLAEDIRPFIAVARTLSQAGFAAPEVFAVDYDNGLALLSDLGREPIVDAARRPIVERYEAAVDLLAALHGRRWPRDIDLDDGPPHRVPDFDSDVFQIEAGLLVDWYLPHVTGTAPTADDRAEWKRIWSDLFAIVDAGPKTLVLRDFHSPNILWRHNAAGHARVGLIDFQDALWGHPAYDVMSLAQDARVDIPAPLQARLVDRYCRARGAVAADFDEPAFRAAAAIVAAQRASKILGIFVRLNARDGKPAYLAHLPRMKSYLRTALAHPVLGRLRQWVDSHGLLGTETGAR